MIDFDVFSRAIARTLRGIHENTKYNSKKSLVELQELFDRIDEDGDGHINATDLQTTLQVISKGAVSEHTCRQLIRRGSHDSSSDSIDFQGFKHIMLSRHGESKNFEQ